MSFSITIASGKGGVGKTMLTANLGVALSQLGKKVIIIDADIDMANLTLYFGMESVKVTLNEVLTGEYDISQAKYNVLDNLEIIPAGIYPKKDRQTFPKKLKEVLDGLLEKTDIMIIDSPPVLGENVVDALNVGNYLLLVATPDISSISDAFKTKIIAREIGCNTLGVVLNRIHDDESNLTHKEIENTLETKIIAEIPEDSNMIKYLRLGIPIVLKNPDSLISIKIKELATVLDKVQ